MCWLWFSSSNAISLWFNLAICVLILWTCKQQVAFNLKLHLLKNIWLEIFDVANCTITYKSFNKTVQLYSWMLPRRTRRCLSQQWGSSYSDLDHNSSCALLKQQRYFSDCIRGKILGVSAHIISVCNFLVEQGWNLPI